MEKKASAEKAVREIRCKTQRWFPLGEKIRIVIEGLRGKESSATPGPEKGNSSGALARSNK
jgi:hypothetical protein